MQQPVQHGDAFRFDARKEHREVEASYRWSLSPLQLREHMRRREATFSEAAEDVSDQTQNVAHLVILNRQGVTERSFF